MPGAREPGAREAVASAPVRVLTVGNRYPPEGSGGYERIWRAAVEALRAAGHPTTVLTTAGGPAAPGVHRELAWWWRQEGWRRPGPLAAARAEAHNARCLARHAARADLVCWFSMGGLSLSLLARTALPGLAVVHDGWPLYGPAVDPWTARWGRLARRRYDPRGITHWSANSAYTRDRVLAAVPGLDPGRWSVEHPGIDPAAFPPSPAPPWRGELLVLGRVEEGKGLAEAIRARPEPMRLTIAGAADPTHLARLRSLAGAAADVSAETPRVRFTGPTDAPAQALAAADAVLFPVTWPEPWGLVPLEAMAVGRPVVATGTGGSAEYLRDGENALLVPPGEPAALRAAIERLASEPRLREHLVAGGRAAAARFTERGWAASILALAERLGGGQSPETAR